MNKLVIDRLLFYRLKYLIKVHFYLLALLQSKKKGYPFEVKLPNKLSVQGVILTDQIRSLDWRHRHLTFKCKAPRETLEECSYIINEILK